MSGYTDRPKDWCRRLTGTAYVTRQPLAWQIGRRDGECVVVVPEGFRFDLSVPWALRWAASPHDPRWLGAACLHDWLLLDRWQVGQAGGVFYDALRADRAGPIRSLLMTAAVIAFARRPE